MTNNANRQIARAAGTVMFAILLGQLAGLARGILVAEAFGALVMGVAKVLRNQEGATRFDVAEGGADSGDG